MQAIARYSGVADSQVKVWLSMYMRALLQSAAETPLNSEALHQKARLFAADLSGEAVHWRIAIDIQDGLWLEDESYEIDEMTRLRRPTATDLEFTVPYSEPLSAAATTGGMRRPCAVCELEIVSPDNAVVHSAVQRLLTCLSLYGNGTVCSGLYRTTPESILHVPSRSRPPVTLCLPFKFKFSKDDVSPFREFYHTLGSLLVGPPRAMRNPALMTHFAIALQRLEDSLLRSTSPESRITQAITALEAILLDEHQELSHRLSQRTAILLQGLGFDPVSLYKTVRDAYAIRSKYIHGSESKAERPEMVAMSESAVNVARCCLLVMLQLPGRPSKKKVISQLDNAALDPDKRLEFAAMLNATSLIPPNLQCSSKEPANKM